MLIVYACLIAPRRYRFRFSENESKLFFLLLDTDQNQYIDFEEFLVHAMLFCWCVVDCDLWAWCWLLRNCRLAVPLMRIDSTIADSHDGKYIS